MSEHLCEVSRNVAPGAHCLMQVDGAGWHRPSERLIVPSKTTLLTLPPYSPELNPIESVTQYLCGSWLNHRVWESYGEIVDACCTAWNTLMAVPDRITSIATRDWGTGQYLRPSV
jgi:hypothetical protein